MKLLQIGLGSPTLLGRGASGRSVEEDRCSGFSEHSEVYQNSEREEVGVCWKAEGLESFSAMAELELGGNEENEHLPVHAMMARKKVLQR